MADLLPCPICNCKAKLDPEESYFGRYLYICSSRSTSRCWLTVCVEQGFKTEKQAAKFWKRRAPNPELDAARAECERLRAALVIVRDAVDEHDRADEVLYRGYDHTHFEWQNLRSLYTTIERVAHNALGAEVQNG